MNSRKYLLTALLLVFAGVQLSAQAPNGTGRYYEMANNAKGKELKTMLFHIIKNPEVDTYNQLWVDYGYTDRRSDGFLWDMYSEVTNYEIGGSLQGATIKAEGSSYNREHSFPKSWFGEETPMYTDLMQVVPVDGWVNSMRNNFPYGETKGEKNHSANYFSKLGKCTVSGYDGTVFEPNDEYKGDFARIYFYMATCYEDRIGEWKEKNSDTDMLSGDNYTAYADWALPMLMRWSANDPVSQKEIDRNNAVQTIQGNRNPFVDYPGLEQYVWGDKTDVAFAYDNYGGTPGDGGETPDDPVPSAEGEPLQGVQTFVKINNTVDLETGCYYLVVNEEAGTALSAPNAYNTYYIRKSVPVEIADNTITTESGAEGMPYTLVVGGKVGAYTLYDPVNKVYLAQIDNGKNNLYDVDNATDDMALWSIKFDGGNATIRNKDNNRYVGYNVGNPRFTTYKYYSEYVVPVQLYKQVTTDGIRHPMPSDVHPAAAPYIVYSICGVKVRQARSMTDALEGLPQGVYIVGGKKYVVR